MTFASTMIVGILLMIVGMFTAMVGPALIGGILSAIGFLILMGGVIKVLVLQHKAEKQARKYAYYANTTTTTDNVRLNANVGPSSTNYITNSRQEDSSNSLQ